MNERLSTLTLLHNIAAGIHAFFSCFGLIHVGLGIAFVLNAGGIANPPAPGGHGQGMPPFMGWFFIVIGGCVILLGWSVAALTFYSGRCIKQRRRRTFSMFVAGLNCLWIPLGTCLGVYALVTLTQDDVRREYGEYVPTTSTP